MSWKDRLEGSELVITTGDGKEYRPSWMNAGYEVAFNVSFFDFKETAGTLVDRQEPQGKRYGIEIFFQGDAHLDQRDAFMESTNDKAAWKIFHPYYGSILVQPIRLFVDNTVENVTRIAGEVFETISVDAAKVSVSAPDKIAEDKVTADAAFTASYDKDIPSPVAKDRTSMLAKVNGVYNSVSGFIKDNTDYSDFTNAYNSANALINTTVFDTLAVLGQVQSLINLPAAFADTLRNRVNMFKFQMDEINGGVSSIIRMQDKKLYEFTAGTALGGLLLASVTNIDNAYDTRPLVLAVIDDIVTYHDAYMTNLDSLQTATGGTLTSYIPNPAAVTALSQLVSYTVNALLDIANDSKQERSILLEESSNIILLAKRFYGLLPDDSTIEYFKETNRIGLSEILEIKKGRQIIYYV
jgi:prophage DNA circulation protein